MVSQFNFKLIFIRIFQDKTPLFEEAITINTKETAQY